MSHYTRLAQDPEEDLEAQQPTRHTNRPSHIDLFKLDSAFKRWTESIAQKVKRKKRVEDHSRKEILRTVFEPQVFPTLDPSAPVKTLDHEPPMTSEQFAARISGPVRSAIAEGIHPKMITKGSSGSYFARAKTEGRVATVAVFKPKDEEPYGRLNPKTLKWIHRQLRWIIPFGRACLIPNLSYISEAAASLLDDRLQLNLVPRTELVSLSSSAFFYDWIDRVAAKKGKALPEKIGSMQYFLHGFTDASEFLRRHPWPGRAISDTFDDSNHRKGGITKRFLGAMKIVCGKTGREEDDFFDDEEDQDGLYDERDETAEGGSRRERPFYWSQALQASFREELEKLVILDYLMLNTDRGADNYMIKYCEATHEKSLVDVAPTRSTTMPSMHPHTSNTPTLAPSPLPPRASTPSGAQGPDWNRRPHIHIAAIDNSLSFPHEHPQGWRSYTYGWLYLPVSVIGRPFSEKTRAHFLPLLTDKKWWEETVWELRKIHAVDPDFHPKMFARQLAVIKGQAWNIVQSLKHSDEGPLELTRRTKAMVWDDEIDVSEESFHDLHHDPETELINGPLSASASIQPTTSMASPGPLPVPIIPRRSRSQSASGRGRVVSGSGPSDFPPPVNRPSIDAPRPISFSSKFQRVHPGTTGVTALVHLERLDAVEASLKRLGEGEDTEVMFDDEEEEEGDIGSSSSSVPVPRKAGSGKGHFSPVGSPGALESVPEVPSSSEVSSQGIRKTPPPPPPHGKASSHHEDEEDEEEEDLVAMSKSTSYMETSPSGFHTRWASQGQGYQHPAARGLDWMSSDMSADTPKKTVIVERLEMVETKPLLSCW